MHRIYGRLASKFMIDTGAGVVDADYRGVLFVLLFNHSDVDFTGAWSNSRRSRVTNLLSSQRRRSCRPARDREN
jgi:dUTPase